MRLLLYIRRGSNKELELIHLTSQYIFTLELDDDQTLLCYREDHRYINGFYGETVEDFSVIVGNNGAGKTSLIQMIANKSEDLLGRKYDSTTEDCLIFEHQDEWYITDDFAEIPNLSRDTKCLNKNIKTERRLKRNYSKELQSQLTSYFYSPTLEVNQAPKFSKVIDCSTTGILRNDKKEDLNENAYQRLVNSDMQRQIDFVVNHADQIGSSLRIPDNVDCQITILPTENIKYLTSFSAFEERISNSLVFKSYQKLWKAIKAEYLSIFEKTDEVTGDLELYWNRQIETFFIRNLLTLYPVEEVIRKGIELSQKKSQLKALVNCYGELTEFYRDYLAAEYWISGKDKENKFSKRIKLLFNESFLELYFKKIRQFEMYGLSDMFNFYWEGLSSGENSLLNLFSRFSINKEENRQNILIFVDEIDLGFHPKWQQELVEMILTIFPQLFKGQIQFIMTTHSPLLLSNFRQKDVILLTKNFNGEHVVKENDILTLGANMHKLLANNFFLENALMGAFAKRRINEFFNFVIDNKVTKPEEINYAKQPDYLKSIISEIGEPILRKKSVEEYDNYITINQNRQKETDAFKIKVEDELNELRLEIKRLKGEESNGKN